jgi:hypothetical protein
MVDNAPIIMMKDPLHVGKKLQNPLLSATKIVFWDKHMASKNHLLLILEKINKDTKMDYWKKTSMLKINRIFQSYNKLFFLR